MNDIPLNQSASNTNIYNLSSGDKLLKNQKKKSSDDVYNLDKKSIRFRKWINNCWVVRVYKALYNEFTHKGMVTGWDK